MKRSIFLLGTIFSFACGNTQPIDKHFAEDTRIVGEYVKAVQGLVSPNELIVKAALSFLNTPYVAQTLEGNEQEELVINLLELDCMTLVENCLALSRTAQYPDADYNEFVRQLKTIRYRSGILNGYTSRLHYTIDWMADNSENGLIDDINQALGGKRFHPNVYFMSAHPDRYPSLQHNPDDVEVMKGIEQTINQRNTYYYIPKEEIKEKQSLIQSGDMIGFTTGIAGLDISHMAIAYWNNGRLSFIHASMKYMKVVVEPQSLVEYCEGMKTNTGIMVMRARKVVRSF